MATLTRARGGVRFLPEWIRTLGFGLLAGMFVFVVMGSIVLWARQQTEVAHLTEVQAREMATRVALAEARAVKAEAQLTAIVEERITQERAVANQTATAVAILNDPKLIVERGLQAVFAAYQNPEDSARASGLGAIFVNDTLAVFRPQLHALQATRLHLGGSSAFTMDVIDQPAPTAERAELTTRERWTFDERDKQDRRHRCVVETSEQTYVLRKSGDRWLVDEIQIASVQRNPC